MSFLKVEIDMTKHDYMNFIGYDRNQANLRSTPLKWLAYSAEGAEIGMKNPTLTRALSRLIFVVLCAQLH